MKLQDQRAAFSLIEVMCALLILGVVIAGMTEGMSTALRSSKEAEIQTAAALLAAGQIELLRADGYVVEGEFEGDGDGSFSNYHWRENVTTTDIEGLFSVKVAVELASSGDTIFELETLLFDPPLTSTEEQDTRKGAERRRERRER